MGWGGIDVSGQLLNSKPVAQGEAAPQPVTAHAVDTKPTRPPET